MNEARARLERRQIDRLAGMSMQLVVGSWKDDREREEQVKTETAHADTRAHCSRYKSSCV